MRWRRGTFRADLYYRLNVFDIRIPPLRERPDDILPLAAGFLREFAGATAELTPEAMEALRRHEWPGNVRELRNVLERALIMCDGPLIDAEHLCLRARTDVPLSSITDLETLEKQAIERAMRDADGNKVQSGQAARHIADAAIHAAPEVRIREHVICSRDANTLYLGSRLTIVE